MPPVPHWATGVCRVPADLPDQARACFPLEVDDPQWFWEQVEAGNYDLAQWNAVWGLRPLWFWSEEFIAVDAAMLSEIRNALDMLVMGGLGCQEHADEAGVAPPPMDPVTFISDDCKWCERCLQITMRDRIDIWLERSGHMGSPYYRAYGRPDLDCDIEAEWALVWSGSAYPTEPNEEEPCATARRM